VDHAITKHSGWPSSITTNKYSSIISWIKGNMDYRKAKCKNKDHISVSRCPRELLSVPWVVVAAQANS